nr:type IX secretion system membrane protein PorP/SprF [Nitritalea halalkaliphila]
MKQPLSLFALLLPLLLLLAYPTAAQQLPQFSQYLFNPIHVNPAYAGYKAEATPKLPSAISGAHFLAHPEPSPSALM